MKEAKARGLMYRAMITLADAINDRKDVTSHRSGTYAEQVMADAARVNANRTVPVFKMLKAVVELNKNEHIVSKQSKAYKQAKYLLRQFSRHVKIFNGLMVAKDGFNDELIKKAEDYGKEHGYFSSNFFHIDFKNKKTYVEYNV